MDGTIDVNTILAILGAVSTLGGAWVTWHKIVQAGEKRRATERAAILQAAKEADAKMEAAIVAKRDLYYQEVNQKIEAVKRDLDALRESVEKDMDHMRTTYNGELRNLGEKIEDLRTELRDQHGQLVKLLTAMVGGPKD